MQMPDEHDESGPTRGTMFCIGCDYPLDGLSANTCPECGRGFDLRNIVTYRHVASPVVLQDAVRLSQLPISAAVALCARLEAHGLAAAMHEQRGGVIGYAELPSASVWVERGDEARATELMQAPQEDHAPWACPMCDEMIEGQFAVCWNCGQERPAET